MTSCLLQVVFNGSSVLVPAQKKPSFPSVKKELQFYLNTFLFLPKPVQWCYLTLLCTEIIAKPLMQSTSCHKLTALMSESTQRLVRFIWLISFFTKMYINTVFYIYFRYQRSYVCVTHTLSLIHHYACAIRAVYVQL